MAGAPIFQGLQPTKASKIWDYIGEGSTLPEIVFSLLDRLPGHGYKVYIDNFYNSVALCERLLGAQTNVCGTLRKNRLEPKVIREMKKSDLRAGDSCVAQQKGDGSGVAGQTFS